MDMDANREEFQRQMDIGHNAAWDQDWPTAIGAYTRAVQIVPEDADAHVSLGMALLRDKQLDNALKIFKRAHTLSPDDPVPLERYADVLERMGRLKEAAQQYIKVSDIYLSQRELDKAIGNWERATQLTPGLVAVHARLAQAYERVGDEKRAVREYLTLAFNFRRLGETKKAIRAVERALRLDRNNRQALNTLQALRAGGEISLPAEEPEPRDAKAKQPKRGEEMDLFSLATQQADPGVGEADPRGPIGEAMGTALGIMAADVIEMGLNESVGDTLQAMEYQRQELNDQAIEAYQRAESKGMRHPAMKLNLGGMMLFADRPKDAIQHLSDAVMDQRLTAGALHALGQAHFKLGDHRKASRYLIQSLRSVDTSLAVEQNEIDNLSSVYDSLLMALNEINAESLQAINERFIGLLSGKDWKQRIAETRRHLDDTLSGEGGRGLVDFLVAKGSDDLAESVSLIDRYIRSGLYTLAMDESHRAVERSPFYLPVHVRMAEIMMKEGRIRQAINKYNIVARDYLVREENDRAASILSEVLEMAPLDIEVRMNLIELLEGEERWDEALDQYVDLAGTYQQLGDFDQASETYQAAERLARRNDTSAEKMVLIKHHIADINQMRLNIRMAQKVYEEILELQPGDEKALRALVDIYYNQGNAVGAVKRLDKLLGIYAKKGMVTRIVQLLQELVRQNEKDTALRARLASIYRKLGQKKEAIAQLDALGELQLEAGQHDDAVNTIKQIIAMKPDRVEEYRRLLAQLVR